MLKAVFFDLDGTLLPMEEEKFTKGYFSLLCKKAYPYGYEPQKLIDSIWKGIKMMYQNDGSKTNEEAFWSKFEEIYGKDKLSDKKIFDDFYIKEFKESKKFCLPNLKAREIIEFSNANLEYVVLSTNPIFPKNGTKTRMSFIDLDYTDFSYVTTYENCRYTKPNPMYFKELLNRFNLKPDEVILFGNNTFEDGDCSKACGIKCYLVGEYVINDPRSTNTYEHVSMDDVINIIRKEISLRK